MGDARVKAGHTHATRESTRARRSCGELFEPVDELVRRHTKKVKFLVRNRTEKHTTAGILDLGFNWCTVVVGHHLTVNNKYPRNEFSK